MFKQFWFGAFAALCGCLTYSSADATTVALGGQDEYIESQTQLIGSTPGTIADSYTFHTGDTAGGSLKLISFTPEPPPGNSTPYITALTFSLVGPGVSFTNVDLLSLATFYLSFLSNNDYTLYINGTTTAGPGRVGYQIDLNTTPIPPALILFGSALVGVAGLASRSRKKSSPKGLPLNA